MGCRSCGKRVKLAAKPPPPKSPATEEEGGQETIAQNADNKVPGATKTQ